MRLATIWAGYVLESLIKRLVNLDAFSLTAIDSSEAALIRVGQSFTKMMTVTMVSQEATSSH